MLVSIRSFYIEQTSDWCPAAEVLLKAGALLGVKNNIEGDTPLLALLRYKKKQSENKYVSKKQDKIMELLCTTYQMASVEPLGRSGTSPLVFVSGKLRIVPLPTQRYS